MLTSTGIAMISVATVFVIARCVARWHKVWRFQFEDFWMLLAYIFFLAMSIGYLAIGTPLFHVLAVVAGEEPFYPNMYNDELVMIKVYFTNTMLLWATLWSVKFSLLFLYRRLMSGLPHYVRWWWGIVAFCVVVNNHLPSVRRMWGLVVGAEPSPRLLSVPSSPPSHPAAACTPGSLLVSKFPLDFQNVATFRMLTFDSASGDCETHRDAVAQIASLYYAYAVDVLSDIMSMSPTPSHPSRISTKRPPPTQSCCCRSA
jgi:hypothetical protein